MSNTRKIIALNQKAAYHKSLGNIILANWFTESAKHFQEIAEQTNKALDSMSLGNYEDRIIDTPRTIFTREWYSLEDMLLD